MTSPTRDEFVKAARTYALAYGRHDDAPGYLPRTVEGADSFEPHAWVVGAMMQAWWDGLAEGRSAERSEMFAGKNWISVSQSLPEKNVEVLVMLSAGSIPSTGQYTGNPHDQDPAGWCYPGENCGTCDDGSNPVVTHWMPLPPAPAA